MGGLGGLGGGGLGSLGGGCGVGTQLVVEEDADTCGGMKQA
jgi:hypothetical protein